MEREEGEAQEEMAGQHQGGHGRIQNDGRYGTQSKLLVCSTYADCYTEEADRW